MAQVKLGALYYPYMRVRDENWLKASALYWDTLYHFTPQEHEIELSELSTALTQAGYLHALDTRRASYVVARELLDYMKANAEVLRARYGLHTMSLQGL